MNFVSNARERLLDRIPAACGDAVDDTVTAAQENASRHSKTGKFADSITRTDARESGGRLESRVGSPLSSAKAKEKGAFITPKRAPYLVFNAGDGVRKVDSVRLAPQPAVGPAVKRFPQFMFSRLVEHLR